MKTSRYGYLNEKLDNSGINGSPIIKNSELSELAQILKELENVMSDIQDKPMMYYFRRELDSVERIIENRKN